MKQKTEVRHTPGPWSLQPIGDESECNVLGAGRELIATVSDNDANIIAAAPDLLEQLKNALIFIETVHGGSNDGAVQEDIRAAIAKAEGGK